MAYRGNFPFGPVGGSSMFGLRREIDRLFEDAFGGNPQGGGRSGGQGGQTFTPAVDAREEEREIVLHMDLPGVRPEDVELSVENGLLTVRGQRSQQRIDVGLHGRMAQGKPLRPARRLLVKAHGQQDVGRPGHAGGAG